MERNLINFFLDTNELDFFQAFWEHQARAILTLHELMVNFCSRSLKNVIFLTFRGALR